VKRTAQRRRREIIGLRWEKKLIFVGRREVKEEPIVGKGEKKDKVLRVGVVKGLEHAEAKSD